MRDFGFGGGRFAGSPLVELSVHARKPVEGSSPCASGWHFAGTCCPLFWRPASPRGHSGSRAAPGVGVGAIQTDLENPKRGLVTLFTCTDSMKQERGPHHAKEETLHRQLGLHLQSGAADQRLSSVDPQTLRPRLRRS